MTHVDLLPNMRHKLNNDSNSARKSNSFNNTGPMENDSPMIGIIRSITSVERMNELVI